MTMNLNINLVRSIPFDNPTPVQRKTLPLILNGHSIMGIARTGSGKTLCYLIPAIQNAVEEGKNTLILVPTKELVFQIKKMLKYISRNLSLEDQIEITTPKLINSKKYSMIVVDEIDRILEEPTLKSHFDQIMEGYDGQRVYFSATLPREALHIKMVKLDTKIPETIKNTFLYIPAECKESVLMEIIDRRKKTIIFASTKYGVDYLLEIIKYRRIDAVGIYSTMDKEAREYNFKKFLNNEVSILIVTDVAARGIDIPHLDMVISYDMCDEKTFVHRVGRIRGMGEQISLVTYSDVFHFFDIKETHLNDVEIGTVPQDILDKHRFLKFKQMKYLAQRGYHRCVDFRHKISVPSEFKNMVSNFTLHSRYAGKLNLADKLKQMRQKSVKIEKVENKQKDYRDQYYIPYKSQEKKIHSSSFSIINKDDYIKERLEKYNRRIHRK